MAALCTGDVAFCVTKIGAVYRCGVYLWLHCQNGSYSTGDEHCVSLTLVWFTGVVFTCGCTVTMAATAVEGQHSASLTLVWFTGVAFTSECTKCRNGSYSSGGTAFCAPCEANMYSTRGAAQCLACKPDEYSGKRQ